MDMTDIEIKKELHKQKPSAKLKYIRKGVAYYTANLKEKCVEFEIPVSDMGDACFESYMTAQHLCRWIVNE